MKRILTACLSLLFALSVMGQAFRATQISGLTLWLKADSTNVPSGGITTWYDASGNGNHAVQGTAANRPIRIDTICLLNYKPVIRFDGTNDFLRIPVFNQSQPMTAFVVWRAGGTTAQFAFNGLAVGNRMALFHSAGNLSILAGGISSIGYAKVVPFGYVIHTAIFNDNDTSQIFENGLLRRSGNPGSNSLTGLNIGVAHNSTGWLNGDIAEIIIYGKEVTPAERQQVENYLRNKYAPPVNLGADTVIAYGFCPTIINAQKNCFSSYLWSTGATTPSISVTNANTYSVTVRDTFGFVSTDTIVVTRPPLDSLVFSPAVRTICLNDSMVLNTSLPTNAYSFLWTNGGTNPSDIFTQPGNYAVIVTDTIGCTASSNQVVLQVDSFTVKAYLAADTTLCAGSSIGLQTTQTGLTYLWNTMTTTQSITIDTSGKYSLSVSNSNSCVLLDTIDVTISGVAPFAHFTFDTVCFGSSNQFTDSSSVVNPNVIDSVLWDFGGGNYSSQQNPVFAFANHGTFPVTQTAYATGGCFASVTKDVIVYENPVAAFDADTVCEGLGTSYRDLSVAASGQAITVWEWDFAGQSQSNFQNPVHVFPAMGDYLVKLTVTTDKFCLDTVEKMITVVSTSIPPPLPVTLLTPAQNFISPTESVFFSWQTLSNAYRYVLEISSDNLFQTVVLDTATSGNSVLLSVPYSLQSYYWRVTAYNRCEVSASSPSGIFTVFSPHIISPQALWLQADSAVSLTGGVVSQWGDISVNSHHAVQGTATNRPRQIDTVCILNNKPVIRFDGNDNFLRVPVFNQPRPMTAFIVWRADGTGAQFAFNGLAAANRMALFYSSPNLSILAGNSIGYTKTVPFGYVINTAIFDSSNSKLFENGLIRASGNTGGNSLTGLNIGVAHNNASWLNGDIAEIIIYSKEVSPIERQQVENYLLNKYAPGPVNLGPDINRTQSICPITLQPQNCYVSYLWSDSSTGSNLPVRATGTYWVRVVDVFGRVSSDTVNVVFPYRGMSISDTIICAGATVTIESLLTDSGYTFLWSNGTTNSAMTTDSAGAYFCIISDSSCSFISDTVSVVVDSFSFHKLLPGDTTMCAGNAITVIPDLYPITQYVWNTPDTTDRLIVLDSVTEYTLIATNINFCVSTDTIRVSISGRAPFTDFIADDICFGNSVEFQNLSLADSASSDTILTWSWTFGDGFTDSVESLTHSYGAIGDYTVQLFITTADGCTGEKEKIVRVFAYPSAAYSTNPKVICEGTSVRLIDNSGFVLTTTIDKWNWLIDNTDTFSIQNPVYHFTHIGEVTIRLDVTTAQGCSDTLYDTIEVFPALVADFSFENQCLGQTTIFTDNTPVFSVVKWQWNFDDGTPFSGLENPSHRYNQARNYFVSLIVSNAIGCIDTAIRSFSIIDTPTASFTSLSGCESDLYAPQENSISPINDSIGRWDWVIDETYYLNNKNPQHQFPTTGIYPVKLVVTTAMYGCADSVTQNVIVDANPSAAFTFNPLYGEAPLEITFTNQSSDADSYNWNFGDGFGSTDRNPVYTFTQNDTFNVLLFAVSDAGCTDSISREIIVVPTDLDISIDEVTATSTQQPDGSVITKVKVKLTNLGSRLITTVRLYITLDGEGLITEDIDTLLKPVHSIEYIFSAGFVTTSSNPNSYVCVEAKSVNNGEAETRLDNNKQCISLTGTIQLIGPVPNPAYGQSALGIILPKKGKVNIAIVDAIGRYVLPEEEVALPEGRSDYEVPVKQMMAGEYFIRVRYNDDVFVKKLVVK